MCNLLRWADSRIPASPPINAFRCTQAGAYAAILKRSQVATWADVRRIALHLPGTSEATSRSTATWTVGKKSFAWERPLRRSDFAALGDRAPDGPILGVSTGNLELKEALLAAEPAAFTTPHFDGYAAILIDLPAIDSARLERILIEGWLSRAPKRAVAAYLQVHQRDSKR